VSRSTHADRPAGRVEEPPPDEGPVPELAELQQRDAIPVAVPVRPDGPVETHELPSRSAPAFAVVLGPGLSNVLSGLDRKRKRATLLADGPWRYSHSRSSPGVYWPADVPLMISHGDAVWAAEHSSAEGTVTLSVIVEVWAD
jgi:hypothetical protein